MAGVPVLAVVIKYNLITSGLCRPRAATWWAVIAPWIFTGFLYNTDLFTTVLNWVALIFQGFTNFTLPPLLFLAALRQGHAVGTRQRHAVDIRQSPAAHIHQIHAAVT